MSPEQMELALKMARVAVKLRDGARGPNRVELSPDECRTIIYMLQILRPSDGS